MAQFAKFHGRIENLVGRKEKGGKVKITFTYVAHPKDFQLVELAPNLFELQHDASRQFMAAVMPHQESAELVIKANVKKPINIQTGFGTSTVQIVG